MKSRYLICTLSVVAIFAFGTSSVQAQDPSTYDGVPPQQLLERSINSSSLIEKGIIRAYLAKKYPATDVGLFSKAWIADYEGRTEDAIQTYKECTTRYPALLAATRNFASLLEGREQIEAYSRILQADPSFQDYVAIRSTYFAYVNDLKDKAAADAFLKQWEEQLPGVYVFDFVRGLYAQYNDRDYLKAEDFYLKAISKKPKDFEVYQRLTDLRFEHLSDNTTDLQVRFGYLDLVKDYSQQNPGSDEALMYLADKQIRVFKSTRQSFQLFKRAFEVKPTAEAASQAYDARYDAPEEGVEFLLEANTKLPKNHKILERLGYHYSNRNNDKVRAEAFYKEAISCAYITKDEVDRAVDLALNIYQEITFEFDRAEQLYLSYLNRVPDKSDLLHHLFSNRRYAQDFKGALNYLDQFDAYLRGKKSINETYFFDKHKEVDRYLKAEEQAVAYHTQNPLHKIWQDRFPTPAQYSITFAANKDVMTASDKTKLAQIASLMLDDRADKYIFSIDGLSGPGEAEGEALAKKRAATVLQYLNEVLGVPLSRMRANGRRVNSAGASEDSLRRVSIVPVGNSASPSILATAALNAEYSLAVSPDGRLLATGTSPMQLWDAQQQIRLKNLGRGGPARRFSPDGRYLAAASNFTEVGGTATALLVYDVRTGLLVSQVPWPFEISELDWSPDSNQIVFTTATFNKIVVYDVAVKKLVRSRISPGKGMDGGDEIVWSKDGKYIIAGRAQEKVVRVYDSKTLDLLKTLDGVDWTHALGSTVGGTYLVCADNKRMLSVWDTQAFALRQMEIPVLAKHLIVHPSKPLVAISDFGGQYHNQVVLVDLANMRVVATYDVGVDEVALGFSPRGDKLYVAREDRIEVLDGTTLKEQSSVKGTAVRPRGSASDKQHNYYLSYDEDGVHVWNILTGRMIHTWNESVNSLHPLSGEQTRFVGLVPDESAQSTSLVMFDTNTFQQTEILKVNFKVQTWVSNKKVIAVAGVPFTRRDLGSEHGIIEVYDRNNFTVKSTTMLPLVMDYLRYRTLNDSGIPSFDVNEEGTEAVVTSYWQDGFGHADSYAESARVVDLKEGKVVASIKEDVEVREVSYNDDNPDEIEVRMRGATEFYDRRSGKYLRTDQSLRAYEHKCKLDGGKAELRWGENYIRHMNEQAKQKRQLLFDDDLQSIEVFENKNLLVTLSWSNEISFFNLSTFSKVITVVSKRDSEWIAYAPSGEFAASINGSNRVYWSVGDEYLEFGALKTRFEQPTVVAERLDAIFRRSTETPVVKAPSLDPELFVVPYSIRVLSLDRTETSSPTYKLRLKIEKAKTEMPEPMLEYWQQGRKIEEERGAKLVGVVTADVEREFSLVDGLNVIQVSINYKNAMLATQTVYITKKPGPPSDANSNLWFLGIGISDYKSSEYSLQFADKDVRIVAEMLKGQEGKLYRKVHCKLLLNGEATAANIKAGMHEFLKQASDQDTVMIFIAGHGTQDNDQTLYFMSHESELNKPYTGIDLLEFQRFLLKRPVNQRAVFCMDICHSGAYGSGNESIATRGPITMEEAVKQLSDGTGLVVLASSTGRESSLESSDYGGGHGAFTFALLEGLRGNADTLSGDKNGFVSIAELQNYVARRVPDITKGRQHPTVPLVQQLKDFPLVASLSLQ